MLAMFARSPAPVSADARPPIGHALDTAATGARINADGLYGPASQAWRLNREATLLLGAGPRALLMQIAHPLGGRRRRRAQQLPGRPLAPAAGNLAELPDDRLRHERRGTGRDSPAEPAPPGSHRPGSRPAPGGSSGETYTARDPELSLWVHATLIDATLVAQRALDRTSYVGRTGQRSTARPARSPGPSASPMSCCRPISMPSTPTWPG